MRAISWILFLLLVTGSGLRAQEPLQLADRGPRFLLASHSAAKPTIVDAREVAVLSHRISLDIDDVTLEEALTAISRQAGLRLMYSKAVVPLDSRVQLQAKGITVAGALTKVLFDAGVDVLLTANGQAVLTRRTLTAKVEVQVGSIVGRVADEKTGQALDGTEVIIDGTQWRTLTGTDGQYRLADVDTGTHVLTSRRIGYTRQSRSITVTEGEEVTADFALQAVARLDELVTTAQKREERLIDVPQSVSILPADELAKTGATQLRDFANTVPGLSFTTLGAGLTKITLRGVTAGGDISPTVGIYIDEVPYGSSTGFGNGAQLALDVGLFDLDRIEVLRGPQGTLYGASTMGGLLKYVTKRPDATRFGVDVQAGTSGTRAGRPASFNGEAAINAPITDKVAIRASGFYSRDGGYIDNVALGLKDVNRSDIYGGRADLLFTPADALTIRIGGFLQGISRDGEVTANYTFAGAPEDGSLEQRRLFVESFDQPFRLGSGTVTYDLGPATLTSISSYQTARAEFVGDISPAYVPLLASIGLSYSAVGFAADQATDKFTQEVRLASEGTQALEWRIGGFYTHETSEITTEFVLRDPAGQPAPNDLFTNSSPSRYEEYAAFGDLTWHLTDKFNVTGGIRYARNSQRFEQIGSGLFGRSRPITRSTDDVFTYLANARYHFSDHATGYLRYATGYRPGGPNFVTIDATTGLPVGPATFEADRLKSYEVGFKAETADGRFGLDVAGYYIDWSNIQILVARGGFSGIANAPGGASVRGAELALTARPARAFTVTGAFAYQDAEMSEADPDLGAAKGERLPNVPRFTAALNADYELPVGSLQPTVGATLRYMSDRRASFDARPNQYRLPDYTTVDLRTGFTLGAVNAQLYVRNLFDERGQLSANIVFGAARVAILQPRTVGITARTHF